MQNEKYPGRIFTDDGAYSFGKDGGLVHEAVVTGRKAGAGVRFWTALAESEMAFKAIVPLVLHRRIIEKCPFNYYTMPSDEQIHGFGEWLERFNPGGCVVDNVNAASIGIEKPSYFDLKSEDEQRRIMDEINRMAQDKFWSDVMRQLVDMGIHPAELGAIFMGAWEYDEATGIGRARGQCVSNQDMLTAIRQLRTQRQLLLTT